MNKKELKEQVYKRAKLIFHPDINDYEQEFIEVGVLRYLIDQLDDPTINKEEAWKVIADEHYLSPEAAEDLFMGNYKKKTFDEVEKESKAVRKLSETVYALIDEIQRLKEDNVTLEKQIVPQHVFDWIERQRKYDYEDVLYALNRALLNSDDKVKKWVNKYKDEFCRAWVFYPLIEIEKKKVYRFEQEAFLEQDIEAESFTEARAHAMKEWNDMFEGCGLFGQPNYKGVVDDEGNLEEVDAT